MFVLQMTDAVENIGKICSSLLLQILLMLSTAAIIMRPSSLGGGCILRRTLSVRPSRYRCHR